MRRPSCQPQLLSVSCAGSHFRCTAHRHQTSIPTQPQPPVDTLTTAASSPLLLPPGLRLLVPWFSAACPLCSHRLHRCLRHRLRSRLCAHVSLAVLLLHWNRYELPPRLRRGVIARIEFNFVSEDKSQLQPVSPQSLVSVKLLCN